MLGYKFKFHLTSTKCLRIRILFIFKYSSKILNDIIIIIINNSTYLIPASIIIKLVMVKIEYFEHPVYFSYVSCMLLCCIINLLFEI